MEERLPDEKLDRLLQQAYPTVEVSPDFTLRLWRRLMQQPLFPIWRVPVPAAAVAMAAGIATAVWGWGGWQGVAPVPGQVASLERMDLFGNAPYDTIAGSVLAVTKEGV